MDDVTFDALRREVDAKVAEWCEALGLGHWRVTCYFHRTETDFAEGKDYDPDVAGRAETLWEYLSATIHFNLPKLELLSEVHREDVILHELMHVFLAEMATEEKRVHEERVATLLGLAFRWSREYWRKQDVDKDGEGVSDSVVVGEGAGSHAQAVRTLVGGSGVPSGCADPPSVGAGDRG